MKKIEIDISKSNLCLLYSEPNGNLFVHDYDTYWKINDFYLEVKTYSYKNYIQFTIIDGLKTSNNYQIHNILYKMSNFIIEQIEAGLSEFNIEEHDINIRVIKEIPNDIKNGIKKDDIIKNINICINNQRHRKLNDLGI